MSNYWSRESGRSSKRRNREYSTKECKIPSSALWLGYVEDGETPEMIMKKFEKLEQLEREQTKKVSGHEGKEEVDGQKEQEATLSQDQLEKLFTETSYFSVGDMMAEQAQTEVMDVEDASFVDDEYYISDDEDQYFGDAESFWDEEYVEEEGSLKRKRKAKGMKETKVSKSRLVACEISGEDGYVYSVKKKARQVDPNAPVYIRIPPTPIPPTWAKIVKPYADPAGRSDPTNSAYFECRDILQFDLAQFKRYKFQAVLIDPPWRLPSSPKEDSRLFSPDQLGHLHLEKLISVGILFVWVEKEIISQVIQILIDKNDIFLKIVKELAKCDFTYVENLVWVKHTVNNQSLIQPYTYFNKSKSTLLLFKRGTGPLELRHQRNPDVVFDYVRDFKGPTEVKPDFVYNTIETLLPTAQYSPSDGFHLLELWSKKNFKRQGWITVHCSSFDHSSTSSSSRSKKK